MDNTFSQSNNASTEWSGSAAEGGTGETQRWENWRSAASEGGEERGDHEQQEAACCPVCMERRPPEAMCRLRCFHQVCAQCLPQLQVGRCPICRERIHPIEPPVERPRYAAVAGMLPGRQAGESIMSRTALLGPQLMGEDSEAGEAGEAEDEERNSGEPMVGGSPEGESLGAVDQLLRSSLQEFMDHMRHPTMTHTAPTSRSHAPAPTHAQRSSAPIHVVSPEVSLDEMYSPLLHDDEEILSSSHPLSPGTEATPLSPSQERTRDRRAVVVVCAEDSLYSTLDACRTLLG